LQRGTEESYWQALLSELLTVIGDDGGEATADTSIGVIASMSMQPAGSSDDAIVVGLTVRPGTQAVDTHIGRLVAALLVDQLGAPRELHAGFCEAGAFHVWVTVDRAERLTPMRGSA
jgi:hypothetical protein